jgi:flagellin
MSLSIRTNVASLTAQRNLQATQTSLDGSLSRLSSGYRISKAGDDAAGLGISTKLESQIRSYSQATRNANDGVSMVQASESALNEQANILTRLRELAMQSTSDGVGNSERSYLDTEAQQLLTELQRIADVTEYNGTKLLDGSNVSGLDFHVGIANGASDVITLKSVNATTAAATGSPASGTPAIAPGPLGPAAAAAVLLAHQSFAGNVASVGAAQATIDAAAAAGGGELGGFAAQSALHAYNVGTESLVNATSSGGNGGNAQLTAADSAFALSYYTQGDTLLALDAAGGWATSAAARYAWSLFYSGWYGNGGTDAANTNAGLSALGFTIPAAPGTPAVAGGGLGVAGLSLASKGSSQAALDTIDAALGKLSTDRAQLGATGNRLQSAISNIQAFSEALSAANSRIKDVDVAMETSNMSRAQILAQAGVSVLAQANQMPQLALKLLG